MSSDDIKSLVNMQLDDMANWEMFNVQVTGDGAISYDTYSLEKGKLFYLRNVIGVLFKKKNIYYNPNF